MMKPVESPTTAVGVVVARFQVDRLTAAHIELLETVMARHPKVVVVLGVAPLIGRPNNPLDVEARMQMIRSVFPGVILVAHPNHRNDTVWSLGLDRLLALHCPLQTCTLYGARDSFLPHYLGKYPTCMLESADHMSVSGSAVRGRLSQAAIDSPEFRAGVIVGASQGYPRMDRAVDIAVFDDAGRLLLGRKLGEELYRFPGGYCEISTPDDETDARREVMEETGLETGPLIYLGSCNIPDWRYLGERGGIRTSFFATKRCYGSAKAGDDLDSLHWTEWATFQLGYPSMLMPEHQGLGRLLCDKWTTDLFV